MAKINLIQQDGKNYIAHRAVEVIRSEVGINYDDMKTWLSIDGVAQEVDLFTMGQEKLEVYTVIDGTIYMVY